MLLLYRQVLRAAKRFPSIKRDKVVEDIKAEFRDYKVSCMWFDTGSTRMPTALSHVGGT